MVLYRLQIDAIMRDQATAQAVFGQLKSMGGQYLAVGKEGCLFEPSTMKIVTSSQDTDHTTDVNITDPAIIADIWAYIREKYPSLDPGTQDSPVQPTTMRLHDCYHDTTPPQPCVIEPDFDYAVTAAEAVAMNLPVLGSVVSGGDAPQIITAALVEQIQTAQAAEATTPTETLADQMAAQTETTGA